MNAHHGPPVLRGQLEPDEQAKVGWLELFFDLVYVAAIIQAGNVLADDPDVDGFVRFAALFLLLWWTWLSSSEANNRIAVDDAAHRVLVLVQMYSITLLAISVGDIGNDTDLVGAALALNQAALLAMYLRARARLPDHRSLLDRQCLFLAVGVAAFTVSELLPTAWVLVAWAVAFASEVAASAAWNTAEAGQDGARTPGRLAHLRERFGLLTLIVLGETFVKLVLSVAGEDPPEQLVVLAPIGFVTVTALWWLYFDEVSEADIRDEPGALQRWRYGHLPLHLGITALGVGIGKLTGHGLDDPEAATDLRLMSVGLFIALLALALIVSATVDQRGLRRPAVFTDVLTAVVVLVCGVVLALLSEFGRFLALATVVAATVVPVVLEVRRSRRALFEADAAG